MKLKCNALLVTVIISLLVFILVSGVIMLAYYNRLNNIHAAKEVLAINNLSSAMNFVLGDTSFNNIAVLPEDVFKDTVQIERGAWGLCQFAAIRSVAGKHEKKKAFLYGTALPPELNACLYLADHGRPLSLAGKTRLTGDVFIPATGMTPGYVDQHVYDRTTLAEGAVKTSGPQLPDINEELKWNLRQLLQQKNYGTMMPQTLTQSFFDSAYYIHQKKLLVLNDEELNGRIIIQSDSAIVVGAQCKLTNVLLVAPRIEFKNGFKGSAQAFAYRELLVGNDCVFFYPSSLVLLEQGKMVVQAGCVLNGMLMALSAQQPAGTEVTIETGALINGLVYANGHTWLQGKVNGIVLTDFFVYRSTSTEYENYLTNAEINRSALSPWFISAPLFYPSTQRKVMQWLN